MDDIRLIRGDCLEAMRTLPDASVDAVVTDPPAGISFMSKAFDDPRKYQSAHPRIRDRFLDFLTPRFAESLRVAKPGSVLLCWAIPRTSHWTGTAVEDAGWQIENRVAHIFGSGFPKHKSHLKPAVEDWWLARKPGPKWLGIEACRVGIGEGGTRDGEATAEKRYDDRGSSDFAAKPGPRGGSADGRWPANLVMSHSPGCRKTVRGKTPALEQARRLEGVVFADDGTAPVDYECVEGCPIRLLGEQGGIRTSGAIKESRRRPDNQRRDWRMPNSVAEASAGSAARFFANFDADPFIYCPKAGAKDRGPGNTHPTAKNTDLMRWLCRLATPEGGTILDPFMGSGSTGVAAHREGFGFVGIEGEAEYFAIAERRIAAERDRYSLFGGS